MATILHVFSRHMRAKEAWAEFTSEGCRKVVSKLEVHEVGGKRHIFARVNDLSDARAYAGMHLTDVIFHDSPDREALGYLAGLVR